MFPIANSKTAQWTNILSLLAGGGSSVFALPANTVAAVTAICFKGVVCVRIISFIQEHYVNQTLGEIFKYLKATAFGFHWIVYRVQAEMII